MRISASTVAGHRFGTVRRRGYDPSEVDAAMDRVSDALRDYELLTARLDAQLKERHEPIEAIARALELAERTKAEMISEGVAEAERIEHDTRSNVDDMIHTAWIEAKRVRSEAENEAASILLRVERRLERAESESGDRLLAAELATSRAQMEAVRLEIAATEDVAAAVANAEAIATERVAAAEQQRVVALARLATLRSAVTDVERDLVRLSEIARSEFAVATSIIDLHERRESIDLTDDAVLAALPDADEEDADAMVEPLVVDLASIRDDAPAPDGSGRPPASRPSVSDVDRDDAPHTFYRRRAARLSSHIEEVTGQ